MTSHHLPDWALEAVADYPAMMTRTQFGKVVNVSLRTVDRWIATGQVHAVYPGGHPRIPRRSAAEFIASARRA